MVQSAHRGGHPHRIRPRYCLGILLAASLAGCASHALERAARLCDRGAEEQARLLLAYELREEDDSRLRAGLEEIDRYLADGRIETARSLLEHRRFAAASREVCAALRHVPDHVEGLALADRLEHAEARERERLDRLAAAVAGSRWEEALRLYSPEDDPDPYETCQGRVLDFLTRAFDGWRDEHARLAGERDRDGVARLLVRAERALRDHPLLFAALDRDVEAAFEEWRHTGALCERIGELSGEAADLFARRSYAAAQARLAEGLRLAPDDEELQARMDEVRALHGRHLYGSAQEACMRRDWGPALEHLRALAESGWKPARADAMPLAELRRRCSTALLEEAARLEQEGFLGNALLALLEEGGGEAASEDRRGRISALARRIVAAPLVHIAEGEAADVEDSSTGAHVVLVRLGAPEISEQAQVVLTELQIEQRAVGWSSRPNPWYAVERARLERARLRVAQLARALGSNPAVDRPLVAERLEQAQREVRLVEARLARTELRQARQEWERTPTATELIEVKGRASRTITILGIDGVATRRTVEVDATLEVRRPVERIADESSRSRTLAAEPGILRGQLERTLDGRLEELLVEQRRFAKQQLLGKALQSLEQGLTREGVEYAVRFLLDARAESSAGASFEPAFDLIVRWSGRTKAAVSGLLECPISFDSVDPQREQSAAPLIPTRL